MEKNNYFLVILFLYATLLSNVESVFGEEMSCSRFEFDHKLLEGFVRLEQSVTSMKDKLKTLEERVDNLDDGRKNKNMAVAFTAFLNHQEKMEAGNTLTFNRILNNAGSGYNSDTGIFTAPVAGTYIFSFQIEHWETKELTAHLVLDNAIQVSSVIVPRGRSTQSGNTAIIGLQTGQTVWVKTSEGHLYGSEKSRGTTFTGALLY